MKKKQQQPQTWRPLTSRDLYCDKCNGWVRHVLSPDGEFYIDAKGHEVQRHEARDRDEATTYAD